MKNYTITVNGNVYDVTVEEGSSAGRVPVSAPVVAAPVAAPVPVAAPAASAAPAAPAAQVAPAAPAAAVGSGEEGSVKVNAPMPGKIISLKAKPGQAVKKGEPVLILEAMKMENEIVAPSDGTVATMNVSAGDTVEAGDLLVTLN